MYKHACKYITVDYQQIVHSNVAIQIHGFTVDIEGTKGLPRLSSSGTG